MTVWLTFALLCLQDDPLKGACDQAAAHLSAGKAKEALALLQPLMKSAAGPSKDRYHYYLGLAAFGADNDFLAGRALSRLAPFENPLYAAHARYLLARVHHRAGELSEAALNYDAVPVAFEKMPPAAKAAPPAFVGDALFHSAVLLYEQKEFGEALARFQQVLQKDKRPEILDEARLRAGFCQVRSNQPAEALKTLQPLLGHAKLARVARWWAAKAAPAPAEAVEHLQKALEAPAVENGPDNVEIQLALGDALERAAKPAEAVEVYKKLPPSESTLARLAGAHASAKQLKEAEDAAARFEKDYAASPLLSGVLLRVADGALAEAQASPAPAKFEALLPRYQKLFPTSHGNAARYRAALTLYRLNRVPEALARLREIPENDRVGELAPAAVLLAECVLRAAPIAEEAVDALQAAALLKDYREAAAGFSKALPDAGAAAPDVMMKLAGTLQQVAALLKDPAERVAAANQARELYEAFRAQHANHPLRANAEYERANCYVLAGDLNTGLSKFPRFRQPPFSDSPIAPLALLREAQLLRQMNNPGQAAAVLAECRQKYEAGLLKDAARASWVPLIRWHQAVALKAANQGAQAVPVLEALLKDSPQCEWAASAQQMLKEVKK